MHSDSLRFGFRRFQTAFGILLVAVFIHFLLFLVPGLIHRRWEGEMGGYFVIPAVLIFCAIVGCGGLLWIFGFKILRIFSRLIYLIVARKRTGFAAWDRVFCRSLWSLPWVFAGGALVYLAYFAGGWGGWPDDVVVGTLGNLLGAMWYGPLFYQWYRLCQEPPQAENQQVNSGSGDQRP